MFPNTEFADYEFDSNNIAVSDGGISTIEIFNEVNGIPLFDNNIDSLNNGDTFDLVTTYYIYADKEDDTHYFIYQTVTLIL